MVVNKNRILSAGGAEVIKTEDLQSAGVSDRINLVLSDKPSLKIMKELIGDSTLIADHVYLRDVLLKVSAGFLFCSFLTAHVTPGTLNYFICCQRFLHETLLKTRIYWDFWCDRRSSQVVTNLVLLLFFFLDTINEI